MTKTWDGSFHSKQQSSKPQGEVLDFGGEGKASSRAKADLLRARVRCSPGAGALLDAEMTSLQNGTDSKRVVSYREASFSQPCSWSKNSGGRHNGIVSKVPPHVP